MISLQKILSLEPAGTNVYWNAAGKVCGSSEAVYGGRLNSSLVVKYTFHLDGSRSFVPVPAGQITWVD